ncbi:unnamed protein product [Camellia sinensis]
MIRRSPPPIEAIAASNSHQDTLYVHSTRQFYITCFIAGTVDFIFGNAAALFQDCDIHARKPDAGHMLTAQGRIDKQPNTGIVIQKCRIDATADLTPVKTNFPTYLGRPWKEYSRTIFMQSTICWMIDPAVPILSSPKDRPKTWPPPEEPSWTAAHSSISATNAIGRSPSLPLPTPTFSNPNPHLPLDPFSPFSDPLSVFLSGFRPPFSGILMAAVGG